jgi:hypothetical protein
VRQIYEGEILRKNKRIFEKFHEGMGSGIFGLKKNKLPNC